MIHHSRISIASSPMAMLSAVTGGVDAAVFRGCLAERLGVDRITLFSAARYGLAELLRHLPADKPVVLAPAFGCRVIIDAIQAAGRQLRLVDVDTDRYCLSRADLSRKLSDDVAAVLVVHEFGVPADPALFDTIRAHSTATIIEDAAIALGAEWASLGPVGRQGDAVLVSGGVGKPFSAWSAGAVGVRAAALSAAVIEPQGVVPGWRNAALLLAAKLAGSSWGSTLRHALSGGKGGHEDVYEAADETLPPSSFDLALLARQLEVLDQTAQRRFHVGGQVVGRFRRFGWATLNYGADRPMFGRIPAAVPAGRDREAVLAAFARHGIEASVPGRACLPELAGETAGEFPNAAWARERLICVTLPGGRASDASFLLRLERTLDDIS